MISFDRPWALLILLLLIVYFWALTRRSYAGLAPSSLRLALGMRILVAALLTCALAGAHLVKRSDKLTTMFVLDVSRSIRPDQRAQALEYIRKALASKGRDDPAGVIVFGRTSYLEDAPVDTLQELGNIRASVSGDATDLAGALRLAGAAFPPDTGRKIVVLSDGNENIGDAEAEMEGLRSQGVRIDVAPTALGQGAGGASSPEAMVDDVSLPTHVRVSAPFGLRVVVSSTVAQKATLTVLRDGKPVVRQSVTLKAGKNAFSFPEKVAQTGFHRYDAQLLPTADGTPENNQAFGFVTVQGRPRVLYVAEPDSPGATSLKKAMAAQDIDVQVQGPGAVPSSVAELASYDSVILSDVPSEELGPTQMAALEEAVKDFGVGLGMIGGPNSFGAGHYNGTPIEAALPVKMDVRKDRRLPAAAIVVVLDASGSMSATEDGVEKVQLGARAAVQLMGALQPDDQVAVTAVTETTDVIVPLEPASKAASAKAAIEGVHAGGGGIFVNQGLTDAYAILLASKAPIKHVILCSDTSDSEQQQDCLAMAAEMRRKNHITTTVCGIGQAGDQHAPFLRSLAHAGGGQIFIVNQAADLPRLFQRDVQTIQQNWFVEKPFLPRYNASDTVLAGIPFATAPPLLGYNLSTPKPGATVALSAPGHNDPIFAYWRYGLGRTFAFTSDDRPHWAIQWLPWAGYERFWAQALRWSLRSNTNADFQTTVENRDGKGHLVVDAFNQSGGFINKATHTARVVAP
ncbi:MAG: VWA domain-containing protein, partial [Armatimonadota bacterium]|nr:VWA domain-containing protein [Armatimonadota bacterium]